MTRQHRRSVRRVRVAPSLINMALLSVRIVVLAPSRREAHHSAQTVLKENSTMKLDLLLAPTAPSTRSTTKKVRRSVLIVLQVLTLSSLVPRQKILALIIIVSLDGLEKIGTVTLVSQELTPAKETPLTARSVATENIRLRIRVHPATLARTHKQRMVRNQPKSQTAKVQDWSWSQMIQMLLRPSLTVKHPDHQGWGR